MKLYSWLFISLSILTTGALTVHCASAQTSAENSSYGKPVVSNDKLTTFVPDLPTARQMKGNPVLTWYTIDFDKGQQRVHIMVTGCAVGHGKLYVLDTELKTVPGINGSTWVVDGGRMMDTVAIRTCLQWISALTK